MGATRRTKAGASECHEGPGYEPETGRPGWVAHHAEEEECELLIGF